MKKTVLLFVAVLGFLLNGCAKENDVSSDNTPSLASVGPPAIIVRASNDEISTGSSTRSDEMGTVVFTGNDILWFNETTKEIRFNDNFSMKDVFSGFRSLKFYMDGKYLFSSMIYVNSTSSQVFNSLVFYYNIMENKYFLLDGYPAINNGDVLIGGWLNMNGSSVPATNELIQQIRDENRQQIESDWNKFINQLKKEGKYKSQ